jgi:hypothetical protein
MLKIKLLFKKTEEHLNVPPGLPKVYIYCYFKKESNELYLTEYS